MKVIAEGMSSRSKTKIAIRMKDTTGVDFISKTAGSKSFCAIFEYEHTADIMNAVGIAMRIPVIILTRDKVVKVQNSFISISSHSRFKVSIGVGKINGLLTAKAPIYHKADQNAMMPAMTAIFLKSFMLLSENFVIGQSAAY